MVREEGVAAADGVDVSFGGCGHGGGMVLVGESCDGEVG